MITCLVMIYHSLSSAVWHHHSMPNPRNWNERLLTRSFFFFCCLFMLCTSATNQQRGICKTLPDSPIADLLKDSKHRVTLLRNTLSENQEMAALWALMFYFQAYKPNHHTIWHKYTCYCVPSWNLVYCTRYNMGIAVISSYTIIIIVD